MVCHSFDACRDAPSHDQSAQLESLRAEQKRDLPLGGTAQRRSGSAAAGGLLAVVLWVSGEAAASSGWEHVAEATRRLEAGDYEGTRRELAAVASGDAARRDADGLQSQLTQALAPRLRTLVWVRGDNQPFEVAAAELGVSTWIGTRLELTGSTDAMALRWTERLSGTLARAAVRGRLGRADVDVHAHVAGRYWTDQRSLLLGGAHGELYPHGKLRLAGGVWRSEELSTPAAATAHVLRDSGFVQVSLVDWHHVSGAARVEPTRYSDSNSGLLAYGWLTYAVLRQPLRVDLGYSAAYQDSEQSRWDHANNRYHPYPTPLSFLRHGPVASVAWSAQPVVIGASVSSALMGNEADPTTYGYYDSRRTRRHFEAACFLRIDTPGSGLELHYTHLRDGYYVWHTARLSTHVVL